MFIVPISRDPHRLSRLLDDSLERLVGAPDASPRVPALDVADTGHAFVATLEIPGVAKDDVKLTVEGRRVSVEVENRPAPQRAEGERFIHRERVPLAFSRRFTLPQEVLAAEVTARLEQGVLTLTLPKRVPTGATRVTIN